MFKNNIQKVIAWGGPGYGFFGGTEYLCQLMRDGLKRL